jgi:biopolymer transport protein ExbB/TolQ
MYKLIDIIIGIFVGITAYITYKMIETFNEKKDKKINIFKNIWK